MRNSSGFFITKEIENAYINALRALEEQNSDDYFTQLEILYHSYESKGSGIRLKNVSFELFLKNLADHFQTQIKALSQHACVFYLAINDELTHFTETAAVMTSSLSEDCAPQSKKSKNLTRYRFLFSGNQPKLPVPEDSTTHRMLQLSIGRVLIAEKTSRLFLGDLAPHSSENLVNPIPHELIHSAFKAFDYETSPNLLADRLFELAQKHWLACIAALNAENITEFYRALAALAKVAALYLMACGKDTLGESRIKFFKKMHASFDITEKNFSKQLNEEGLAFYENLFNYHLTFSENASNQNYDNFEQQTEFFHECSASTFCRDLLPTPREFGRTAKINLAERQTEIQFAIQSEFYDPENLLPEQKQQLSAYERKLEINGRERANSEEKILKSQSDFLTAIRQELDDETKEWHLAGKSKAFVFFFLCCSCAAYKTPDGIRSLQTLALTEKQNSGKLFKSIEKILSRKLQGKNLGRSQKTKDFYALWHENMEKAKRGEFTTSLRM